jgi:uncharacterized protein (TIGR00369 family)
MPKTSNNTSVEALNHANQGRLPGHLGLVVLTAEPGRVTGRFEARPDLIAPIGFLFAGAVLTVADMLCAYGVSTVWPEGASGFTTAEVKCNFMSTLTEGAALATATLLHGGRTTQVWDCAVTAEATGRLMAAFRCTQILLYPKA